ncbi:ArnT family glycosyltransferase [Litchfieldella rifensis]|uniref:ArnT family glycosyltransferase n=1 Tax=Litchfieldella rifensis TaxID=762643 RepID=A0ABV7LMU6_9GAMM
MMATLTCLPTFTRRHERLATWLLILLALLVLGLGIGLRDPWPADEPRFALNALEMPKTGNFWLPHRGGELYPDKPPLFMWVTALGIALTGSVRLGFLLPSLLAALGTLTLVMDLLRRLHGRRIALLGGIALLTTLQFTLQAKTAQIDMLLTFFTTLGAYGLLRHALLGPAWRWWCAGWAAMGLGILTKGVGFLPLALLPAWYWLGRDGQITSLRFRELIAGIGILLAVVALWGLPMIVMTSLGDDPSLAAYRDNILFKQTGERYADAWHHVKPWYYYLSQVLPWAWMPLTLALPWAIPAWWRRFKRHDTRIILPLSAMGLIIVFFSLSPGKRGVYMLPTIPFLVLAMAPLLPGLWQRRGLQHLGAVTLVLLGGVLLAAGMLGKLGLPALQALAQRHDLSPWAWWITLGVAAMALLGWLKPRRGLLALTLWFAVFWGLWSTWGYSLMNETRSPNAMMQRVAAITGPDAWLALPAFDEEFLLQSRQPSVHFGYHTPLESQLERAYAWLQQAPDVRWMLIDQHHRDALECVALDEARDLGFQNSEEWWLIPATAVADCRGDADAAPLFVAPTSLTKTEVGTT